MNGRFTCEDVIRAALGEPVKRQGAELFFRCPYPERHSSGDANPSLQINAKKNVWGCFPCNAKGTAWALAAFLARLDGADKTGVSEWLKQRHLLNASKRSRKQGAGSNPVATYTYSVTDGIPVARKLRFQPGRNGTKKDFTWQRFEDGGWVDGLAGQKTPLYRNCAILNEQTVVYVEGEKAADAGALLGLATTTAGGVNCFRPDHAEALSAKHVVILPDNDPAGREHAQRVAAMLAGKATSVRIVELSGLPDKGDLYDYIERGGTLEGLLAEIHSATEWKAEEIDAPQLLDCVAAYIRRFVSLSEGQKIVTTVWAVHTHVLGGVDTTAYLAITSAEKQSGKTRLLEVLETLVARPWLTGRVTSAVLTRKIDAEQPTLLLDESDAAFGGEKEYAETLRGVLNTGYRRGGVSSCCIGKGSETSYKDFSTFSPKAIAGIGRLPDTIADRSVPIRLKRAARGEDGVLKFRRREVEAEAADLRHRIESWAAQIIQGVSNARPQIPDELSDRQQDAAESLLAIADLAGGRWPNALRTALVGLCVEAQHEDGSTGYNLLSDIRQVFDDKLTDRMSSADLACALVALETSPWGEWNHGKPISQAKIARLLRPFEIMSHNVRIGEKVLKGYERQDFEDAWKRYLQPAEGSPPANPGFQGATPLQVNIDASYGAFSRRYTGPDVATRKDEAPSGNAPCSDVAFSKPPTGMEEVL
jgi:hypothetical protein